MRPSDACKCPSEVIQTWRIVKFLAIDISKMLISDEFPPHTYPLPGI